MQANKNIYRAILLLSFLGLNVLMIFGISSVWSYLNTGADRSNMLHLKEDLNETYQPKMVWSDDDNEGRPMENQTLLDIQKDYLSAWHTRNRAYATNDINRIADFYTDSARVKLYDIIALNKASGTTIHNRTIAHYPKIEFYSEDGQMVVFTDSQVTSCTEIYSDEKLLTTIRDTTSYEVMLMLEDGFWRIRHQVAIPVVDDTLIEKGAAP